MFDLEGKAALVTGASGGIGAEIARVLHGAGASVGLSGTRVEPLEALASELGDRAHVLPCNLSEGEDVADLPKRAAEAMGSVDILVNNAGITRDNLFMRMSEDDWDAVLARQPEKCHGAVEGRDPGDDESAVGPDHQHHLGGRALPGNPGQANYAASKAGLVGLSKSLAYEVASRGITVNCIAPGFIQTAMTDKLTDDQKSGILAQIPSGRMGDPAEIASAVLYLASDEASYVTGTTLHINGGMAML